MIAYTSYLTDGRVRLEAESLVKWGYEVHFLTLKSGRRPQSFRLYGVRVIELNVRKYRGKSKLFYLLSYLHFLVRACVVGAWVFFRSRIKVIHVHNMPDVLVLAGFLPKLFGCKIILDIHDSVPETYAGKFGAKSGRLFKLLSVEEHLCCLLADKIICVNHVQRETLVARGVPIDKLHTVITMPTFPDGPAPKFKRDYGTTFRVVNHGTISKRLGIDLLIKAVAKLVCEIPELELHVIGGGDDLDDMVRLADDLGLLSHAHFRGAIPWDTLSQELKVMDVGVVANRANIASDLMLPLKLIDYVSLGIPAVVPKLKAIEYYFSPDMVSYFEPESVECLARAMLSLYQSKDRGRQQAANAKRFIETYKWSRSNDLQNLYGELFKGDSGTHRVEETA